MMKKNFYVLFAIFIANIFSAQTDLVRWALTSNGDVSYSSSRINATSVNTSQNPISYDSQGMNVAGWNNGNIEHYRYFGFSVGSSDGSSLTISNLAFQQERLNPGPQNYTIRYYIAPDGNSIDDYNFLYNVGSTVLVNNESIANNPVKNIPLNVTISGTKRLIVRFYSSGNDWGAGWRIKANTLKLTEVQASAPVANNDTFTAYKNVDNNLDILANDVSGTSITGLTITQQPSHGTITVNGTTSVTYKPATGYTGTDSFKYKATNATGLSNEATASVNVIEMPPSPLVRWNNGSVTPTTYNSNITAGNITTSNVNMGYATWSSTLYSFGGWPSQTTVNNSYYVQFSVSPKNGYKLNLSEFNFQCFMTGSGTMKIDYSLSSNFSNPITLVSGITPSTSESSPTTISLTNFNAPVATDGQIVYVRVYVYNTYQTLYIKYANGSNSAGPAFIGTVSSSSAVPVATNDAATTTIDNDIDINVLENDDYSNIVNSITLSQPLHGTATLNSDNTVNYLPGSGYIGADSFTYSITNQYGISNIATVSVNVNPATTTSLIRWDSASATYYPTSYQSFISASSPVTAVGTTLSTSSESLPVYVIGNINDSSINTSKYIQFRLNNTSTAKTIEPKSFNFSGRGYNSGNYEIRYSKSSDFSGYQTLASGTFSNAYAMISANFDSLKIEAGETLYIRVYFYNTTSSYVIQYYTGSTGPAITGLFYNKVYSSTDTIWQNASSPNWSNGTPTATKNAIIATAYNTALNGNFESNNLTINTGATLVVNSGGTVTVNGKIINNANSSAFIIENNANLLQYNNAQNNGNITVKKSAVIPKMGYNYWSSPVIGQNLYQFSEGYNQSSTTGTGTPWNRFYIYNEANDYFVTTIANEITLGATSVFESARGYAIRGKNSFPETVTAATVPANFEFVGTPQNGDVSTYKLKWTNAAHGYNMVGNPYPSNINFDSFYELNSTKIYGIAYFWTNNDGQVMYQQGSSYSSNNYAIETAVGGTSATYFGSNNRKPNGNISLGQGFIVQAKPAGKNQPLAFNNSLRTADNANYYNKTPKNRFWLELKSPSNVNNEILIGYIAKATNNFDSDYDADLLSIGSDSFWNVLDSHKLAIQAKDENFTSEDIVKLGYKSSVEGSYTISINEKEGIFNSNQNIYLKDKYLNKVINITQSPYTFNTNAGQYEDRFEVIYKTLETLGADNSVKKGIQIYKDVQNFIVNSPDNLDEVSLYDSLGRLIFETKNAKKEVLINKNNLPEGMYIIKAKSGNTTLTKKVIK